MKRLLIILLLIATSSGISLHAQTGLNISEAFSSRFRDLPEATETIVSKSKLRNLNLSVYHSISITGHPELYPEFEKMVMADGSKALSKEVRYAGGHLYYGLYALPPVSGEHRYILYVNSHLRSGNKLVLLYIEGKASIEQIKKLISK